LQCELLLWTISAPRKSEAKQGRTLLISDFDVDPVAKPIQFSLVCVESAMT